MGPHYSSTSVISVIKKAKKISQKGLSVRFQVTVLLMNSSVVCTRIWTEVSHQAYNHGQVDADVSDSNLNDTGHKSLASSPSAYSPHSNIYL